MSRAFSHTPPPAWLIAVRRGHHLTFTDGAVYRMLRRGQRDDWIDAQHATICKYTLAAFETFLRGCKASRQVLSQGDSETSRFEERKEQENRGSESRKSAAPERSGL